MGLDVYLQKAPGPNFDWDAEDSTSETIEKDSGFDGHYWKVGYWRSSYNDAGFNYVVHRWQGCFDLYDIVFGPDAEGPSDYYRVPTDGWQAARDRAATALSIFRTKRAEGKLALQAFFAEYDASRDLVNAPQHAINRALKEFRGDRPSGIEFSAWSSNKGEFFSKGLTVRALMAGTCKTYKEQIGVWVVTDVDAKELDHYEQCYQIVILTLDEVINSKEPELYRLAWSS